MGAYNVEAVLTADGAIDDETIRSASSQLAMWRDERSETRPQRLTRELLLELRANGYVATEHELRARRSADGNSSKSKGNRLFGASQTSSARLGDQKRTQTQLDDYGGVADREATLLMRVRPRRNGRQLQLSMEVLRGPLMNEAQEVISAYDGSARRIGYDHVKRKGVRIPNLARFEAPEMEGMKNPVARFRWVRLGGSSHEAERVLQYELFDAESSEEGAEIFEFLNAGISAPPVTKLSELGSSQTVLSKPDPEIAQWYRLYVL